MFLDLKHNRIIQNPQRINLRKIDKRLILLRIKQKNRRDGPIRQVQFTKIFIRNRVSNLTTQKDLIDVHKELWRKVIPDVVLDVVVDGASFPVCVGSEVAVTSERSSPESFCESSVSVKDERFGSGRRVLN